jgi:hypothetical protein
MGRSQPSFFASGSSRLAVTFAVGEVADQVVASSGVAMRCQVRGARRDDDVGIAMEWAWSARRTLRLEPGGMLAVPLIAVRSSEMGVELLCDGPLDGAFQGAQQQAQADVEGDLALLHPDETVGAGTLEFQAIAFPVEAGVKLALEGLGHLVDLSASLTEPVIRSCVPETTRARGPLIP